MVARLTQEERRQRTRSRLVAEGERELLDRGYVGARLDVVAERAGVTRQALYKHFPGKEGLILAVGEERLRRHLADAAPDGDVDLHEVLGLSDGTSDMARWVRACGEFAVHVDGDSPIAAQAHAMQRMAERALGAVLQQHCRARGVEPGLPAEELAVVLLATLYGLHVRAQLGEIDVGHLATFAIEAVVTASAPQAQQAPTRRRQAAR